MGAKGARHGVVAYGFACPACGDSIQGALICSSLVRHPIRRRRTTLTLSSRPEQSGVEGPAVLFLTASEFKMSKRDHHYFVYIVASRTHVLYCGMTNSIERRVEEHRRSAVPGFTYTYQCDRLVCFERYQYVRNAINREKQIKGWRRSKKIWLIEQENPTWADLSEEWRQETADPTTTLRSGRDDKT
jgi:putative endonuclease